jgi:hypothetical protein
LIIDRATGTESRARQASPLRDGGGQRSVYLHDRAAVAFEALGRLREMDTKAPQ